MTVEQSTKTETEKIDGVSQTSESEGVTLTKVLLSLMTAALGTATAVLGFVAANQNQQRDELASTQGSLERENQELSAENAQLRDEIDAARSATSDPTTPSSDGGSTGAREQYLSDLPPLEHWSQAEDWEEGTVETSGTRYDHGMLALSNTSDCSSQRDYNLGQAFSTLTGTIGLSDTSIGDSPSEVQLRSNGTVLYSAMIEVDGPKSIDIDVSEVVRLEIVVNAECADTGVVAFGDLPITP